MNFSLTAVAAAVSATLTPAGAEAMLSGVAVDSRRVRPGDLFVALPGAKVDGHDYAGQAAAAGARAMLGSRRPAGLPADYPVLAVEDPRDALLKFAGALRKESGFRLAAVAGSVGKTTTKEFAAAILSRRFSVEKTPGNQNSAVGFPMSVINLPRKPAWMVGEMGMSALGEISRLSRTFEPDVAAITRIAAEHLEFLGSLDTVAEANGEILEGLKPDGIFVANADDTRVAALAGRHRGRTLWFGLAGGKDVTAEEIAPGESGTRLRLKTPAGGADVTLPLPGLHQVENFLAASAVAIAAGATAEDCAAAAPTLAPASHRGELHRHSSGALLYDDAYNASPPSMRAALDTLKLLPGTRKIGWNNKNQGDKVLDSRGLRHLLERFRPRPTELDRRPRRHAGARRRGSLVPRGDGALCRGAGRPVDLCGAPRARDRRRRRGGGFSGGLDRARGQRGRGGPAPGVRSQ